MAQTKITDLHLIFLTSCLLLQFCFVFFLCLFLNIVGSTPESQVVRGRVRSVAHPAGHRIVTINQSQLLHSCSIELSSGNTMFIFSSNNSPGRDSSLMIGGSIHRVDPGGTTQHVHRSGSRKRCGRPFPCVSHHVIQSCRKSQHCFCNITKHTIKKQIQSMFFLLTH